MINVYYCIPFMSSDVNIDLLRATNIPKNGGIDLEYPKFLWTSYDERIFCKVCGTFNDFYNSKT